MPPIIGIQFHPAGKQYHFDAQGVTDLVAGDRVVVETARGRQLGIVTGYVAEEELEGRACKPIERCATPSDLVKQEQWQAKALDALVMCEEQAQRLGLKGIKFARAEYSFDGSQVTILYATENKRVDMTALRRELKRGLRTRVELYQIGPRDFAKLIDGLGACGARRCCARFLTQFSSVSIRMAKLQNISLTPSEVTGVCGRLRCCLTYEHELYAEAAKGLPKRGREIVTPYGKGRVVEVRTLVGQVVVDIDGVRKVVEREDVGKEELSRPPVLETDAWLPAAPSPDPAVPEEGESAAPAAAPERKPSRSSRSRRRRRRRRSKPATAASKGADRPRGRAGQNGKRDRRG